MAEDKGELRSRIWRVLQIALAVIIVVAVFVAVIPQIADYGDVWRILATLSLLQLAMLAATAIVNLATYWLQSIAAMPGLTLRDGTLIRLGSPIRRTKANPWQQVGAGQVVLVVRLVHVPDERDVKWIHGSFNDRSVRT